MELLGKLVAAQMTLEKAIGELARSGASTSVAISQLSSLAGLQASIGTADAVTLMKMTSDIASAVAQSKTIAEQAHDEATATSATASAVALAETARASRENVNDVMRGMKDFDHDLKFSSPEDQTAYREREAERRAYVIAEQAKHTPQGDLNASGGAVGQMADAAAHGAAASPEFQQRWNKLTQSTQALRDQLIRDGKDVSGFDRHMAEDLRTMMRAKGVPDTKIDALLAAHPDNPLEAVKAFVAEQKGGIGEKEIDDLSRRAADYKDGAEAGALFQKGSTASAPMVDAMAQFRASGVVVAEATPEQPAHGVTAQVTAPVSARTV